MFPEIIEYDFGSDDIQQIIEDTKNTQSKSLIGQIEIIDGQIYIDSHPFEGSVYTSTGQITPNRNLLPGIYILNHPAHAPAKISVK